MVGGVGPSANMTPFAPVLAILALREEGAARVAVYVCGYIHVIGGIC